MLAISQILSELLEKYFLTQIESNNDCRLLVPGLTPKIARQIHDYLIEKKIDSYLVVGEDEEPNESCRLIRPVGLTSKRIGSFIAISNPGQLIHIQDSIRGSGGTIRAITYSEEWPWIDNGNQSFLFDGPVLDNLIKFWGADEQTGIWVRDFVLDGLVKSTRFSSRRANLLLEDILGSFSPSSYSDIDNFREKFLFHSGVPSATGNLPEVEKYIKSVSNLRKAVIERCQKDENIREQVKDAAEEIENLSDIEKSRLMHALDVFLDGMGRNITADTELLAFYSCWGNDKSESSYWRQLSISRLEEIFGVTDRNIAEISFDVRCDRSIATGNGKKLASFSGEEIFLDVSFEVSLDDFYKHRWEVKVLNRQQVICKELLKTHSEKIQFEINTKENLPKYSKKILLRIALFRDGQQIDESHKLEIHLCGEDRRAFAIVEPGFIVVDATISDNEETPDKKIIGNGPFQISLLSHSCKDVMVCDSDEENIDIIETEKLQIWRLRDLVDTTAEAINQVVRICKFGELSAVICLEGNDIKKGEFTLEDELRVAISTHRGRRFDELVNLHLGKSDTPYTVLGQIDSAARRRIEIARQMTGLTGWRPLLFNLFSPDIHVVKPLGNFVNCMGHIDGEDFRNLDLPPRAVSLLENYSKEREEVYEEINSRLNNNGLKLEHPIYASHPIYSKKFADRTGLKLSKYLEAYFSILDYLDNNKEKLEWLQLFALVYLDCAVHWDDGKLRNAMFLIGPWHPLVIAKRFMIQAALVSRAEEMNDGRDQKSLRHLTVLLDRVQGFRWFVGVSEIGTELEPMCVSTTTDPGWHIAFRPDPNFWATSKEFDGLSGAFGKVRDRFGLTTETVAGASETLVVACLNNYLRAFPSRRSIGISIESGYAESKVISAVDQYLHDGDEGPTEKGQELSGGVRLYVRKEVEDVGNVEWSDPPLYLYQFEEDISSNIGYDINMLSPFNEESYKDDDEMHELPRGIGLEAVFSQPLNWIAEGKFQLPLSITSENDLSARIGNGVGDIFVRVLAKVGSVHARSKVSVRSIKLPKSLTVPWMAIPGEGIDPAVLVKYVRDGHDEDRNIQARALWDYKIDLVKKDTSFYIVSTIPKGFEVAVNGFFGEREVAKSFVVELGRIGISIGGEALRSGRHALGVIGLVGAVRLFGDSEGGISSPIACNARAVGFIVPVDSFASFFGMIRSSESDFEGMRGDLLVVQLALPNEKNGKIRISCCGVESKFTSGSYTTNQARNALKQACVTTDKFKILVEASLGRGSMPERLGMLEILKFGLRTNAPNSSYESKTWRKIEEIIYKGVLERNYEYCAASYDGILVSTEAQLPGISEYKELESGIWIRLTRGHWPGVSNTKQLESMRKNLSNLFGNCINSIKEVEPTKDLASTTIEERQSELESPSATKLKSKSEESGQKTESVKHSKNVLLEQIFLGMEDNRRSSIYYNPQSPVDPLENMNLMVTGSSGTGKTQLLKYIICKIREQDKPILILDFKNDFASDAIFSDNSGFDRVFVAFDGVPYNPLIPYPVKHPKTGEMFIQCGQHIAGVASVLKRTYGLGPQQQAAVKNAMNEAFVAAGLPTSGSVPFSESMSFPDFSSVGGIIQDDSPSAYSRLDPLFTLGLFKDEYKESSFQSLVGKSAILDLSQIPSDEIKNTIAQLIVLSAHAYFNSQAHSGTIRQILIFDEAHRVLSSDYMLKLVRECRAYGVATLLSSQYPSDFPSEISASMATKIIHGNGRDLDRVKNIVQIVGCEGMESDVANLEIFQAIFDNRQHPHTLVRTMNYPLYLVWSKLQELGHASREQLSQSSGLDTNKLSIGKIIRQLELLGLAEERDEQVHVIYEI